MQNFNPLLPSRCSIRLKGYDYSQNGLYFITICCANHTCYFGNIENHQMFLSDFGQIAYEEWLNLSKRFINFQLNTFQVMPNHFHAILELNENASVSNETTSKITIAKIIAAYKSIVFNRCLSLCKEKEAVLGKLWQRNYYEHIIRDEAAYQNISNYIVENPLKWKQDKFYHCM